MCIFCFLKNLGLIIEVVFLKNWIVFVDKFFFCIIIWLLIVILSFCMKLNILSLIFLIDLLKSLSLLFFDILFINVLNFLFVSFFICFSIWNWLG